MVIAPILLLVATSSASTPPTAPDPTSAAVTAVPRIAIVGLRNDGVPEARVMRVIDALAHEMSATMRVSVLTATEIQAVLGLEQTREVLACSSDESCAALDELTRALDVNLVVAGSVGARGDDVFVTLSLVDTRESRVLSRATALIDDDDDHAALSGAAEALVEPFAPAAAGPAVPILGVAGIGAASVGAITAAAATVLFILDDDAIRRRDTSFDTKEQARSRYAADQAFVVGGALVGATGVVVAAVGFIAGE